MLGGPQENTFFVTSTTPIALCWWKYRGIASLLTPLEKRLKMSKSIFLNKIYQSRETVVIHPPTS